MAQPTGDLYVAANGNDAWSGKLPEPDAAGTNGPFATLAKARDAVRGLIAAGLSNDVKVLVRGGTYYLPEGLTFDQRDSGTEKHSITYAVYPGEEAWLIGGVRIIGWTKHRGDIWRAPIPQGIEPTQLFENGRRLELARTPKADYFRVEQPAQGRERRAFVYKAKDIDPAGWDTTDASVLIWAGHDWWTSEKPIASTDPATRTITLAGDVGKIGPGNRYLVRNLLAALDAPGDCFISSKGRMLFCWPRQTPIEAQTLVAATAPSVISVVGQAPDLPVRNLHFEGLNLSIARGNIVAISGARGCSVRFCLIENAGDCGVVVGGHSQQVTVYGNLIRYHGVHGVALHGLPPGQPDMNRDHVVENNHIHHCGQLAGAGYGVEIMQSGHNKVVHNHIHHMPRYGATIKGVRYQSLRTQVKGVTWDNRHDFLHSRGNLIAFNDIHHVNLDSQDTGALESWGPGRDNVYDHNLIHDVGKDRMTLQSGLYLDDATDYFTVTNNIIYGVVGAGGDQCIYVKGIGNKIDNNILIVAPRNESAIRSLFMADERCDNHEYTHNIIVLEGAAEPDRGAFGRGVGNLHNAGTSLTWKVNVPADGEYQLWVLYAAENAPFGRGNLDGRTQMSIDGGEPVSLQNLPDTGGWGAYKWSKAATLKISRGERPLRWTNVQGGGLNWDAFALCDDPDWQPTGTELAAPAQGKHLVVVHAESHLAANEGARRFIYDFNNWSDDRVAAADYNVFWAPNEKLAVRGGPANGSFDKWLGLLDRKFDQHSLVADPMFVDPDKRDYHLKPESPALKRGFKDIDTSQIGLNSDFPARFEKE